MKKLLPLILIIILFGFQSKAQTILYSNTFSTSLGTATAANGSSGNWIFSNNCAQSTAGGHSAPGHAIFSGSGCQFGNGSSTVSGDLVTPSVAIGATGGTLSFSYFIANECLSGSCTYDVLKVGISTNNGVSYTDVLSSNTSPGGLINTSAWTTVTLNLVSYTNTAIKVLFNFNSGDGIGNAYDGIYVDDINILGGCSINVSAVSGGNTVSPGLCSGQSLTLTTNAVSGYTWSTGSNSAAIVVNPSVTTAYSLTATSVSNCVASAAINVTVSGGMPVVSINTSTNNICLGKTVTLTATGANVHTWSGGVTNGVSFSPSVTSVYTVTGSNGCGVSTATTAVTVAPLAVSIVANPSVVCAGQLALLTVSAAANSYTWSPINSVVGSNTIFVSPQTTTNYSLSAGDGTCSGTAVIQVVAQPVPTVNVLASSTLICQGDLVTITASGGVSYTWATGGSNSSSISLNPTASQIHSVTASNSVGCTAGGFVAIVTEATPTLILTSANNLICEGDAVTINVTGATTYTWSNGSNATSITVTPTNSIIYSVTGTSNTCIGTETINIDVFSPSITITGSTTICSGKTATLTGSGASTYSWSNGIPNNVTTVSPLVSTSYTLSTLTSSGSINCAVDKTVQVTVLPNPTVTAVSSRSAMCRNESNEIIAGGASTYSWSTASTTSSFVITPTMVTSLSYSVIGYGANGCENTASVQVKVNSCTGINDYQTSFNALNVYPNPNNGEFIVTAGSNLQLLIVNQLGQTVKTFELNERNHYQTKISGLSSGLYFVKISNTGNALKIIVQ